MIPGQSYFQEPAANPEEKERSKVKLKLKSTFPRIYTRYQAHMWMIITVKVLNLGFKGRHEKSPNKESPTVGKS